MHDHVLDQLLDKPFWVIDILPWQVPADAQGQYFAIERYWLQGPPRESLRRKLASVLIKLNCYVGMAVCRSAGSWTDNPSPATLEQWVMSGQPLQLLFRSENALITLNDDDHYMTLYNPDDNLLKLVGALAAAEGLFVWKPAP